MAGDEVDAHVRVAPVIFIDIAAAGQAIGKLRGKPAISAPKATHRVAVAAVPLRPANGKVSDLVAAGSNVPRLRDQFDQTQRRVLVNEHEEARELIDFMQRTRERGCQVEAKAIYVHVQ